MRTHMVEVDDEVFAFVQKHAEALVDNFNSALRKLLPLAGPAPGRVVDPKPRTVNGKGTDLSLPSGTPQALRQILEVVSLVRGGAYTRTSATRFVAKQHGVAPQTVLDKYGRQLQLTAQQFDRLLEREDASELRKLLKAKFPQHEDAIGRALG